MSLVIAVKSGGKVLFGADTQATGGYRKMNLTGKTNLKITRMPCGVIVGHAGSVNATNSLSKHPEWFSDMPEGKLTKRFLVTVILPKLIRELREKGLLEKDGSPDMKMTGGFLLAQGDGLFQISRTLGVFEIPVCAAIGCGKFAADAVFCDENDKRSAEEKLMSALRLAERYDTNVSGPFVLIDTADSEYRITEDRK